MTSVLSASSFVATALAAAAAALAAVSPLHVAAAEAIRVTAPVQVVPQRPQLTPPSSQRKAPAAPALRSATALVVDQDTGEVLFEKNPAAVLPIASITKLMTALVVLEARLDLDESLQVTNEEKAGGGARSRLAPGTVLTRGEAMQLALMASENRAAFLLGRTYPGGLRAFLEAMNAKARLLDMTGAHFADPTGLSPENRASASDLVKLVNASYAYPEIRAFSTQREAQHRVGNRVIRWVNTNRLTASTRWDIGLQKTGYISQAGRCLVMQATIGGRHVVMVLLDSVGKLSRFGDANRIRSWLEAKAERAPAAVVPVARRAFTAA